MTNRAGRSCPRVRRASPVGQRTPGPTSGTRRHSSSKPGPAARWIAPSTPPPPSIRSFAAFTIASTFRPVMSPSTMVMRSDMAHIVTPLAWRSFRREREQVHVLDDRRGAVLRLGTRAEVGHAAGELLVGDRLEVGVGAERRVVDVLVE